jgi:hypothetical protein
MFFFVVVSFISSFSESVANRNVLAFHCTAISTVLCKYKIKEGPTVLFEIFVRHFSSKHLMEQLYIQHGSTLLLFCSMFSFKHIFVIPTFFVLYFCSCSNQFLFYNKYIFSFSNI